MRLNEFLLLLLSMITSTLGQFLFKLGALELGEITLSNILELILGMIKIRYIRWGFIAYTLSSVLYILLLSRVNLSIVGPAFAFSYVISVFLGYFFFKEAIPIERLIGLAFIVCGVILVIRKWN